MLQQGEIEAMVDLLEEAATSRKPLRPLTALRPGLALGDAYAIQEGWAARHVARGRRRAGYKLGLTTPAAQRALGADRPIYGVLFTDMAIPEGGALPLDRLIAPRIEPELAFVMRAPLEGECSAAQALDAIGFALPAVEIIDNRIAAQDSETGTARSALDIVADAGGTSGFVLSSRRFDPREAALAEIRVTLEAAGKSESGSFADVFGSPENALVELARGLAARGGAIAEGDIVLTGSPLRPAPLVPGERITADFGILGTVELTIS